MPLLLTEEAPLLVFQSLLRFPLRTGVQDLGEELSRLTNFSGEIRLLNQFLCSYLAKGNVEVNGGLRGVSISLFDVRLPNSKLSTLVRRRSIPTSLN